MVELTHRKHSVGQNAYHLIWKPKYNIKVFQHSFPREVCEQAIKEAAKRHKITIFELKVLPDHIHVFAEIPPTMSVSKALQLLKGYSARYFFKRCTVWRAFFSCDGQKQPHLWSPGKFFRSVGNVTADVIENYIAHSQGKYDFSFSRQQQLLSN
jgi:putative transposase|tara:strand:- start:106 stop:567 length:462 start_codon:yes stop_codon:yes gene_type:complete